MNRIEEDDVIPWFKEAALLSYKECESESNDIMLYYDGEFKGMIEVWTDRSHESRMEAGTAEYILLNHTMYYISDFDMNDDVETVVGEKEVVLENNGEVIAVPVNKFGLVPPSIHAALKAEVFAKLAELKQVEQAMGILRAKETTLKRHLSRCEEVARWGRPNTGTFLSVREALELAQLRANETGKTQFVIAESFDGEPPEYTIHKEDISFEYHTLNLYEKVEPERSMFERP